MEDLSRVFQKTKQNMKRLSFITQFKIVFLLAFTGYRKVLGKMVAFVSKSVYYIRRHLYRFDVVNPEDGKYQKKEI